MSRLDDGIIGILACPADHASLDYDGVAEELVCTRCATVYEVRDGIPVLLPDPSAGPR
ncbi:MAG: Trm112 family protein [Hamadaea sp.]|nr:Trm112 family protein [Hamadaea sp.]